MHELLPDRADYLYIFTLVKYNIDLLVGRHVLLVGQLVGAAWPMSGLPRRGKADRCLLASRPNKPFEPWR
jgi:hypothetical protein